MNDNNYDKIISMCDHCLYSATVGTTYICEITSLLVEELDKCPILREDFLTKKL